MIAKENWFDAAKQAFLNARINEADVMPTHVLVEEINRLIRQWGHFTKDTCKEMLQKGNEQERLFALFLLDSFASTDDELLFIPFLQSPLRKERWVSAIILGTKKNERALFTLFELIAEGLALHPPSEEVKQKPSDQTSDDTQSNLGGYQNEYLWYMLHRFRAILLIGSLGDLRAIPSLVHTFSVSRGLECVLNTQQEAPFWFYEYLYKLQDHIAYSLGQLDAWNALDVLDLPIRRLHIARMFHIFGAFRVNPLKVFYSIRSNHLEHIEIDHFEQRIDVLLSKQYALPLEERRTFFHNFLEWYRERENHLIESFHFKRHEETPFEGDELFLPSDPYLD
jgi:hypothetical protein